MESCLSNLPEKHFPRMVYVKPLVFGGVMLLAEIIFFTWSLVLDFWLRSGDNKPVFLVVVEQCLNRVKDFSTSHTALPARRLRAHKELEGDRTRTTNANWLKGCPLLYGVTLSNKSWDIEGMMAFVLPINHYMWWVEKKHQPMGSSKWIPYFTLLVHTALALPIKLSPLSSYWFSSPTWGEWENSHALLSCLLALNHNRGSTWD